ncbi:hypothetical protein NLM27_27045 [Bradyrhizobium sp. CCGB12]|uniref:hypothetical protein n=1 Tax=Bradyrhizobium sp. CCGB12 TaxID=2949632 RepID=UPI0020B3FBD0|nr:hypothetical protein [Bradyrhizobium sp. CCGB12]MCP3392407.1 hypothetical protein [Bradyrhizobium sp. CCGB12]
MSQRLMLPHYFLVRFLAGVGALQDSIDTSRTQAHRAKDAAAQRARHRYFICLTAFDNNPQRNGDELAEIFFG